MLVGGFTGVVTACRPVGQTLTLSPVLLAENDGEALPLCMCLFEKSCLAARSGLDASGSLVLELSGFTLLPETSGLSKLLTTMGSMIPRG